MVKFNIQYGLDMKMFLYTMTFVLFIGKLIGWWAIGWMWVFSPLWLPIAIVLGVLGFLATLFCGAMGFVMIMTLIDIARYK